MVLTVSFVLSPVTGLFCHRRLRIKVLPKPGRADRTSANLTPASGRQDHTTSPYAGNISRPRAVDRSQAHHPPCNPVARKTLPRPPHPHPASVTIAIRPSCGVGWREFVEMICPTGEAKYFCKGGWTQNCPTGKSPRREPIPLVPDAVQRSPGDANGSRECAPDDRLRIVRSRCSASSARQVLPRAV
jgi:hypothetical protein